MNDELVDQMATIDAIPDGQWHPMGKYEYRCSHGPGWAAFESTAPGGGGGKLSSAHHKLAKAKRRCREARQNKGRA